MKNPIYLLSLLLVVTSSCLSQKEKITSQNKKTNLPIKLITLQVKNDSTWVDVFIPQEFKLKHNNGSSFKFSMIHYSLSGHNIYGETPSDLFAIVQDTLSIASTKVNLFKKSKNNYIGYVSFRLILNNKEIKEITKNKRFVHYSYNKKVFEIGTLDSLSPFLNKKIPDSIKGYIHLNYTNPRTDLRDFYNIPVTF